MGESEEKKGEAAKVLLHVYDVTNSGNPKTNQAILNINRVMRDNLGIGGIFHGAVEVYGEEWSFGYCEIGSGVFSCPSKRNPMYTFRETVPLGTTLLDPAQVRQVLIELSREWPGRSYDLLGKNCNHFCDAFCQKLGPNVGRVPLWVNRFANAGDVAVEVAGQTIDQIQRMQSNISYTAKYAYRYLFGATSDSEVSEGSASEGSRSDDETTHPPSPQAIMSREAEGKLKAPETKPVKTREAGPSEDKNGADRLGSPQSVLSMGETGTGRNGLPLLRALSSERSESD
eukprot:TRINITY_DN1061_c0_g1_i1.p1 TRINITY_DN1061_c0_g1~~TRINITY_DN1061_c0_g1_i1.p1  ORF type:complete len:286 (+),score=44.53 TRINITY_DN1061_c0_g1_i1:337-1194(+)